MGVNRRRRRLSAADIAYGESLATAGQLAEFLAGQPPTEDANNWLVTSGTAGAAQWDTAAEVTWDHRVFVAGGPLMSMFGLATSVAGNAARKARAQRLLNVPQWWPVGPVSVEVWSQRFGMTRGSGWWVWDTASVVSVAPGPGWSSVTVWFAGDVPLQLWGPQVPAIAVALVWATSGTAVDPRPVPPLSAARR